MCMYSNGQTVRGIPCSYSLFIIHSSTHSKTNKDIQISIQTVTVTMFSLNIFALNLDFCSIAGECAIPHWSKACLKFKSRHYKLILLSVFRFVWWQVCPPALHPGQLFPQTSADGCQLQKTPDQSWRCQQHLPQQVCMFMHVNVFVCD